MLAYNSLVKLSKEQAKSIVFSHEKLNTLIDYQKWDDGVYDGSHLAQIARADDGVCSQVKEALKLDSASMDLLTAYLQSLYEGEADTSCVQENGI